MGTKKCNAPVLCLAHNLPPACAKKTKTDKGSTSLYPTLKDCENELWPPVRIKKGTGPHRNQSPTKASKQSSTDPERLHVAQGHKKPSLLCYPRSPRLLSFDTAWGELQQIWAQYSSLCCSFWRIHATWIREKKGKQLITAFLKHQCWSNARYRKINKKPNQRHIVHFSITCEHLTLLKQHILKERKKKRNILSCTWTHSFIGGNSKKTLQMSQEIIGIVHPKNFLTVMLV